MYEGYDDMTQQMIKALRTQQAQADAVSKERDNRQGRMDKFAKKGQMFGAGSQLLNTLLSMYGSASGAGMLGGGEMSAPGASSAVPGGISSSLDSYQPGQMSNSGPPSLGGPSLYDKYSLLRPR